LAVNNTGSYERVLAPGTSNTIGGEITVRLVTEGPLTIDREAAPVLAEGIATAIGRKFAVDQHHAHYTTARAR
jgi:hypothetical protein